MARGGSQFHHHCESQDEAEDGDDEEDGFESDLTWLGLSHQLVFLCFCLVASEGSKELRHRHIH